MSEVPRILPNVPVQPTHPLRPSRESGREPRRPRPEKPPRPARDSSTGIRTTSLRAIPGTRIRKRAGVTPTIRRDPRASTCACEVGRLIPALLGTEGPTAT